MPKLEATVRRDQIIRATYKAFIQKGAPNVTLQDIAEYAGCSKGVVAYHFESKEDVFVALLDWLIAEINAHARRNVDAVTGAEAKMHALLDTIFYSAKENRKFFLVYLDFVAQGLRNLAFGKTNISFYEMCREIGREIVAQGIAEGVFRPVDLDEAGTVVRAIFDGLNIQWLFDHSANPDETFDRYKAWALASVKAYLGVVSH
jgi:TetR/AcrR family transcriptional regulator, fatty acid metabolism regulator protein